MPTRLDLRHIALAGLIGQLAFEAYAWLISPILFGLTLEPSKLVVALTDIYLGLTIPYWAGFVIHFIIGTLGFAALVWLVQRFSKMGWVLSGFVSGLVLWFVAQGMLAPAVGRSFMMDFGPYTQSSAVAHIGMSMLMGVIMAKLYRAAPTPTLQTTM